MGPQTAGDIEVSAIGKRGFDLPAATLTIRKEVGSVGANVGSGEAVRGARALPREEVYFLEGPIIGLPFPDATMPYNVIAFTSSILAFFVGSMFSLLYRSNSDLRNLLLADPKKAKKNRLASFLSRIRKKLASQRKC